VQTVAAQAVAVHAVAAQTVTVRTFPRRDHAREVARRRGAVVVRGAWLCLACVVGLAGCLDADEGEGGARGPDALAGAATPGADGTSGTGGPAETDMADAPRDTPAAETWFLHNDITCSEEPCNCGSHETSMDRDDRTGDCDAMGRRSVPLPLVQYECEAECYPARDAMGPFPVASAVAGTLYLTTDVADTMDVTIKLADAAQTLGAVSVRDVSVVGLGGFAFTAVPFSLVLDAPVPADGAVTLVVDVDAGVSYFIGYEDDHRSRFTIAAPGR
jgi:hypothetical protein